MGVRLLTDSVVLSLEGSAWHYHASWDCRYVTESGYIEVRKSKLRKGKHGLVRYGRFSYRPCALCVGEGLDIGVPAR